jgi:hypothetical protein
MKMMEERELKSWIIDNAKYRANLTESNKLIAAFGEAVREDCAKVALSHVGQECKVNRTEICYTIAAAIRGKK